MRREKKWRYYCDYCKKSGASGRHMAQHEKSCTMNPDRFCRMCEILGESQPEMSGIIKAVSIAVITETRETGPWKEDDWISYTIEKEEEAVKALRDVANNCPVCMFAALRQHGYPFLFKSFDFKVEKEAFWAGIHERERQSDYASGAY